MILHQFPDLQWLKQQADSNFANRKGWQGTTLPHAGWPSVVMNVKTAGVLRDNIRGPLSLFTNITGTSRVHVEKKMSTIHRGFFFLTNDAQHYSLEIDKKVPSETLNIHFGEYWADQALRAIISKEEALIDLPENARPFERKEFYNKIYTIDQTTQSLLLDLKNCKDDRLKEEEILVDILVSLLRTDKEIRRIENSIPTLKNSTRLEIIRRLHDSTDYIYSHFNRDISLDDLAGIACMSKFHFLRLFKAAFKKTPHQFVTEVKVKQATTLLMQKALGVKEIATHLGYKDSSTFSRIFFQQTGRYPSQAR